jgi:DNA invertase Pin-like site-specific DNA recombinase
LIDLVDNTDLDLKFTNFHFEKTPSGKMMLAVLFGFAKHYSDNRSELSKRGHSNKGDR